MTCQEVLKAISEFYKATYVPHLYGEVQRHCRTEEKRSTLAPVALRCLSFAVHQRIHDLRKNHHWEGRETPDRRAIADQKQLLSQLRWHLHQRVKETLQAQADVLDPDKFVDFFCRLYHFWDGITAQDMYELDQNQNVCDRPYGLPGIGRDELQAQFEESSPEFLRFFDDLQVAAENDTKLHRLLRYLKTAFIWRNSREITVKGLLIAGNQGAVENLTIEVAPNASDEPFQGNQVAREAIGHAKEAAFSVLNQLATVSHLKYDEPAYPPEDYGVAVYLSDYPGSEEVEQKVNGGSLGLSVALGILQHFLGPPLSGCYAATGSIHPSGDILMLDVANTEKKVYVAFADGIPQLIVPSDNSKNAERGQQKAIADGWIEEGQSQIHSGNDLSEVVDKILHPNQVLFRHIYQVTTDYQIIVPCRNPLNLLAYQNLLKEDTEYNRKFLPVEVFFDGKGSVRPLFMPVNVRQLSSGRVFKLQDLLLEPRKQRILLLGRAHEGKSTLLLQLAYACRKGCLPYRFPVLVHLRGRLESVRRIEDLIETTCGTKAWKSALSNGQGLLLLDGLNETETEVPSDVLRDFARECNSNSIPLVVASRPIRGKLDKLLFDTYEMMPLSIQTSAEKLSELFPDRAQALFDAVVETSENPELFTNPLMFALLCQRIDDDAIDAELPNMTRTALLRQLVEDWLKEEGERARNLRKDELIGQVGGDRISLSAPPDYPRRRQYLEHLAFEMVQENRISITFAQGLSYITEIMRKLEPRLLDPQVSTHAMEMPNDLFEKLISGNLLLISLSKGQPREDAEIRFIHESIRDLMAAECIARHI